MMATAPDHRQFPAQLYGAAAASCGRGRGRAPAAARAESPQRRRRLGRPARCGSRLDPLGVSGNGGRRRLQPGVGRADLRDDELAPGDDGDRPADQRAGDTADERPESDVELRQSALVCRVGGEAEPGDATQRAPLADLTAGARVVGEADALRAGLLAGLGLALALAVLGLLVLLVGAHCLPPGRTRSWVLAVWRRRRMCRCCSKTTRARRSCWATE